MRMHRQSRRPVNSLRAKTIPATHWFAEKRVTAMDLGKCVFVMFSRISLRVRPIFRDQKGEATRVESETNALFAIRCASKNMLGRIP